MSKQPSKIWVILQHEYLKRVKSKGFIIGTLIGPLAMLALIALPVVITLMTKDSAENKIAVSDRSGAIGQKFVEQDPKKFFLSQEAEGSLRTKTLNEEIDGYLVIPSDILENGQANLFSRGGGGIAFNERVENSLEKIVRDMRLRRAGADDKVISLVEEGVDLTTQKLTEQGSEKDYSEIYAGIGYFLGFLIYMLMFIYGAIVMRGVIEEKTNRIVEVLASSASPFDIMMGKILGLGALGLTQAVLWGIMSFFISSVVGPLLLSQLAASPEATVAAAQGGGAAGGFQIPPISPWLFVAWVFYFLVGYFIYATLFAAIGSAVEQESDAQQLQLPVSLPLIIPILFIGNVISDPNGTLATVLSLIPFFTPILMIVRIAATNVPAWQIMLSIILPIMTFFACVWLASRIYRVGILSYGKKPSFKELAKWITSAS